MPGLAGLLRPCGRTGDSGGADRANEAFAHRPVEAAKAWKEMVHRYAAGLLGLVVLGLTVSAWRRAAGRALSTALLVLIAFQAALGMWTVTLLLKPVVVMGHLLGGFSVLSLLWLGYLGARSFVPARHRPPVRLLRLALVGMAVLVVQIALGGWTSANYAALACPTFPKCMGEWWPPMDMADGFVMWRGLGVNYEFGVLDSPARVAVHMAHRAWAVVTFLYLGAVGIYALRQTAAARRRCRHVDAAGGSGVAWHRQCLAAPALAGRGGAQCRGGAAAAGATDLDPHPLSQRCRAWLNRYRWVRHRCRCGANIWNCASRGWWR